jgi:hypothetical protein
MEKAETTGDPFVSVQEKLPYRWGYFQGVMLIPWSLLVILSVASNATKYSHDPWYLTVVGFLMGLLGLPLAIGLLMKKAFALKLVYAMFGLAILLVAIQLPIAIKHYADPGDKSSAFFEAELLLLWLLSMVYYRKRKAMFH